MTPDEAEARIKAALGAVTVHRKMPHKTEWPHVFACELGQLRCHISPPHAMSGVDGKRTEWYGSIFNPRDLDEPKANYLNARLDDLLDRLTCWLVMSA